MIRFFFARLKDRIIWSWAGCKDAWANEHSFRTWAWANAISAASAFALPLSPSERALVLALGVLMLAAELLNTAIERVVDLVTTEQTELAGRAKDAGSAGVALASLAAGVAWCTILWRLTLG